jgi:hypothetical protein
VSVGEGLKGTTRFFLFGMGNRRKLTYQAGKLMDAFTGEILRRWEVISEAIEPAEYCVRLQTVNDREVTILEDEEGVWLTEGEERLPLSLSPLRLPRFEGHPYACELAHFTPRGFDQHRGRQTLAQLVRLSSPLASGCSDDGDGFGKDGQLVFAGGLGHGAS